MTTQTIYISKKPYIIPRRSCLLTFSPIAQHIVIYLNIIWSLTETIQYNILSSIELNLLLFYSLTPLSAYITEITNVFISKKGLLETHSLSSSSYNGRYINLFSVTLPASLFPLRYRTEQSGLFIWGAVRKNKETEETEKFSWNY